MARHLGVNVIEHRGRVEERTFGHRAVLLRFLPRSRHLFGEFRLEFLVLLFGPVSERDQVLLQSLDRVAEREVLPLVLGTVLRGVITGRMGAAAVGDQLDPPSVLLYTPMP